MNQQSQEISSFSPADQPIKRKRGRPRKDDSQVQGDNMPVGSESDSVKKNKQIVGAIDDMVGQMVSGVIEGSFDAGYLLNVKVGDTGTQLRGVVFLPGRFAPITAANDVAPNAKMYKRKEIPIPVLNPQSEQHCFLPPPEQIDQQVPPSEPTETKTDAPKIPDQVPPSELQSGIPAAGENQSDSVMTSLADKFLMNEIDLSLREKVVPQQISESILESQTASIMAQLKHDKVVQQDQMHQETNMDIEASTKLEPVSSPSVDIMPCTENVNQEPQVQLQPLSSDLKQNDLVHNEGKSVNIGDDNHTTLFPKPETMSSEPIGIRFLMDNPNLEHNQIPLPTELKSVGTDITTEKQNSPRKNTPEYASLELANKTIAGEDKYVAVGEATNITAEGSYSAPVPSLSVMMFGGEAISSEPKLETEGSVLPRIIENQMCSSSAATNDADSDMKAAMADTHLDLSSGVNLPGSG